MKTIGRTLQYIHFSPKAIDDSYSKEVFKTYMQSLDPMKRYFQEKDYQEFKKYELKLDDYLNNGDLTFYKLTTTRLFQRMDEVDKLSQKLLASPLNFKENEKLVVEPDDAVFAKSSSEYQNEWKKYIKYSVLQEVQSLNMKEEARKEKKDSINRIKGVDSITLKPTTTDAKISKSIAEVKSLMAESFRRSKKRMEIDWFTIYMNAYTEVFDPHTNYLSPKSKEDFDMMFGGRITGIGAIIQEKKGYLYLGSLTVGAPAWKSKQLNEGDKILKVKSAPNKDAVNVVGMLNDEAVRLIRGPKGTKVTLTVEKKDGSIRDVTMVREEVEIEDTFAKSIVIEDEAGKKYGYINLPSFNIEVGKENGRNASEDVRAELIKLKKQGVSGIILDLRNNGGGSLTEVGDILALFMPPSPYVQVKESGGKISTLKSKVPDIVWNGPLLLMQNELSASASEILAGAVSDYGRGVVLGSPQSYGKGTVQAFVDLNRFLGSSDDFGSLKLTIQKFYRITGESTQRKGVMADIPLKDIFSRSEIGERYSDYALPWDKIAPTQYTLYGKPNIAELKAATETRMKNDVQYKLIQEAAEWREQMDKEKEVPLQWDSFFSLMKSRKQKSESFKSLESYNNGLKFVSDAAELERIKKDEVFAKKQETWKKAIQRDVALKEAVLTVRNMK